MAIHVRCGTLFTGNEDAERSRQLQLDLGEVHEGIGG
jgi:hypothetical protein